jgi:predicted N-acyltransferase
MSTSDSFDFQIVHSVTEVDPESWDRLSAGQPFTSHQWYRYGEAVLSDCEPIYLIVHHQGQPIARATFWRIPNDPILVPYAVIKHGLQAFLKRWPLLACRSPLSSLSGLILPDPSLCVSREAIQLEIGTKANELLHQKGCSFLVFDYLSKEQCAGWPENFVFTSFSDPGTFMPIVWPSFETYLEAGNKKDRQHYKRTLREAEKLGIQISRHSDVKHIEEALALTRGVEQRFKSAENPWARAMLENLKMVDGTFLVATIGTRMVGCGLILEDNGAQMNASLGLAQDVPYVYFMLVYESLKIAFEHQIHLLRLGSGSYEVKQQLGFSLEDNNSLLFTASNPLIQKTGQWLERLI